MGGVPDGVGHGHGMGLLPKDWPDNQLSTFSCPVRRLPVLFSHKEHLRRNRDVNITLTRASSSREVQPSSENRPLFFASRSQLLPRCARHRQVAQQWQRRAFGRRRLILGAQRRRPSPRRCSRRCFNAEKSPQLLGIASLDGFGDVGQGAHRPRVQRAGRARGQPAKGMAGPAVSSCICRTLMSRMFVHSL